VAYDYDLLRSQSAGGSYTFATLPSVSQMLGYSTGVSAFTTDLGLCVWDGIRWNPVTQQSISVSGDPTGATDTAALIRSVTAMSSRGGGIIYLASGTYYINAPIALANGVQVVGTSPQLNFSNAPIPDSSAVIANGGGTIFQAVGSTACFQWNKAVLGVPSSQNAFTLTALAGIALRNLCFNGFTRAVDAGNTNNGACWWSEFENLFITGCTDYGFWITNFMHCKLRRIFTYGNTHGQFYGNDVPSATLQPGNSVWEDIYQVTPATNTNNSRGVVFRVTQGQQNEGLINRLQSNRNNASVTTQAATMANSSANIGVTDVSKFPIDKPCTFSASVNGATANEIYFVVSNPGGSGAGNIQVALTVQGTAVTWTGNSAVNIIEQGFPALEVVALSGAASSSHDFNNVDVENGGTCAIVLQNVQQSAVNISQCPGATQSTQSLCARALQYSQIFARASINTSFDGNSGTSHLFGNRSAGSVNHNPPGFYYDAGLGYIVQGFSASVYGWSGQTPDTSNMIIPLTGVGAKLQSIGTATSSPNGASSGVLTNVYTTAGATWTLPTVSSTVKTMTYKIVNPVGTGQNLTITSTTDFFGPSTSRTSIVMTPGSAMEVVANNDPLGSYYAVTSMVGSYSSGTLTGVTP
jgi:hypothetical protein